MGKREIGNAWRSQKRGGEQPYCAVSLRIAVLLISFVPWGRAQELEKIRRPDRVNPNKSTSRFVSIAPKTRADVTVASQVLREFGARFLDWFCARTAATRCRKLHPRGQENQCQRFEKAFRFLGTPDVPDFNFKHAFLRAALSPLPPWSLATFPKTGTFSVPKNRNVFRSQQAERCFDTFSKFRSKFW